MAHLRVMGWRAMACREGGGGQDLSGGRGGGDLFLSLLLSSFDCLPLEPNVPCCIKLPPTTLPSHPPRSPREPSYHIGFDRKRVFSCPKTLAQREEILTIKRVTPSTSPNENGGGGGCENHTSLLPPPPLAFDAHSPPPSLSFWTRSATVQRGPTWVGANLMQGVHARCSCLE